MTKQNRDKKCVSVTFGMLHDWGEEMDRLNKEIEQLKADNSFLRRQNNALKMRCSNYCLQVRDLESEIQDMRFTRKYLTSEEAGRQLARELTGRA